MNKCLLVIVLPVLLFSCKSKKVSLALNDEKVEIADFLEFFQPLKLPYEVTDTILRRKEAETAAINYSCSPASYPIRSSHGLFGQEKHPRLYAIGKIRVPDAESYLFVKGTTKDRRVLYILCFDKKDHFCPPPVPSSTPITK